MKFSEMTYTRPDPAASKQRLSALTEELKSAKSYEEARRVFLSQQELMSHISTAATLASIRHSIDTRDKFYDGEEKFWNNFNPELEEYNQAWTAAMLESPFRADFEKEYGDLMFVNAEIALKTFSPAIIPELQQENDLTQEYESCSPRRRSRSRVRSTRSRSSPRSRPALTMKSALPRGKPRASGTRTTRRNSTSSTTSS